MKKKLLLSLCLMAIAVVAFCLWYTRPQTFWQATGMDRDNITGASGYAVEGHVTAGQASLQTWMLNDLTPAMRACWSCWSNPPTAPAWKTFCRPPPPTPLQMSLLGFPFRLRMTW